MSHRSGEHLCCIARKHRVGIESDYVSHALEGFSISGDGCKCIFTLSAQKTIELTELPPLPFPSHPDALLLIPQSLTMEEIENVTTLTRILFVQVLSALNGNLENLGVVWLRFRIGI